MTILDALKAAEADGMRWVMSEEPGVFNDIGSIIFRFELAHGMPLRDGYDYHAGVISGPDGYREQLFRTTMDAEIEAEMERMCSPGRDEE